MTLKEYLKNSKEYELFRESKQQRRESSSRKSRTKKVNASLLAKESPIPLESSTRDFTKTVEKTTLSKKRVMKKEYLKSRLKNYKGQSANSNLANLQTEMEYELKTSKIATTRREK